MTNLDDKRILRSNTRIELRGSSGRLYGILDRERLIIEVKRKGERPETIDLRPHLHTQAKDDSAGI